MSTKEALIVRTLHPSCGYSVSVETWDERGHDYLGWRHRDLLGAEHASALVDSERKRLERDGYDVEIDNREASAA
ncbi:protein of unknown function [Methylorubrum extorquens]|uniref:Uncharacterized protein n=1 Tax=Methylorubrum extorquens TaxID=408 RepID=A0A2N9ATJ1_METEX|nr:protein of unknown function [Methylorubrum extorquens]